MTRYRLSLEEPNNKYKKCLNIYIESYDLKHTISKIKTALSEELSSREQELTSHINNRSKSKLHEVDSDIDYSNHKGRDITKEEFIENEIFMERNS